MKNLQFVRRAAFAAALAATLPAQAAFGDADAAFKTATFEGFTCRNSPTLLSNDAMLVHLWDQRTVSSDPAFRHAVAKLKPDGTVDRSFGQDGRAEFVAPNNALNLVPLGDGRILAIGNSATRLLADGRVDPTYGANGTTEEFFPARLASAALLPDGTLMVASQPSFDVQFAWFTPDGKRATAYGLDGRLTGFRIYSAIGPDSVYVYAWSLQADGSVHLAFYSGYNPTPRMVRYSYDRAGGTMIASPLAGVMPAAGLASWTSPAVKVDGFGRLLVAASAPASLGQSAVRLTRFAADGSVDATFGSNGSTTTTTITEGGQSEAFEGPAALWGTPDGGWILVVDAQRTLGIGLTRSFVFDKRALRFTATGQLDGAFSQGKRLQGDRLTQRDDGKLLAAQSNVSASTCTVSLLATDAPRIEATVVEYFHPVLNHYFMTIEGLEVGILDDNRATMGWQRTGKRFGAWAAAPVPGTTRLCRFYGDIEAGPNSHFYIPQGEGCEGLRRLEAQSAMGTKAWRLEGIVFSTTETSGGTCPGALAPVYRFYNRGFEQGRDSNHRYSTDSTISAEMTAKGWALEGVAFCAPPVSGRQAVIAF